MLYLKSALLSYLLAPYKFYFANFFSRSNGNMIWEGYVVFADSLRVFNWGLWLYKVVMLQFLQTIYRSSKALTCMTKLFCFSLIFLLSLQIGITPPWFATDGFSWHVTLACGWELNGPLKIHWSLASSPVLRQLLLPQGLCSCICLYYSFAHSVEYNN